MTKRKVIQDLVAAIEANSLKGLISLDLQCENCISVCEIHHGIDSRITDRNVQLLVRALQTGRCGKLHVLRLSNNAMSVAGCKAMALCLSSGSLDELRHLDLQRRCK